jgi:hypothetical protein
VLHLLFVFKYIKIHLFFLCLRADRVGTQRDRLCVLGKVGTPEREAFRKEAYAYCVGQIISDVKQVPVPCVFFFADGLYHIGYKLLIFAIIYTRISILFIIIVYLCTR